MSAPLPTASFQAIGTTCVVCATDPEALSEALEMTRCHVDALDRAASRFRRDSELTLLNGSPGRPVRVSGLLLELVGEALAAARDTDGLLDPSLGQVLELLGYDRDFSEIAPDGPVAVRYLQVAGWRAVRVDRAERTVTVPRGVALDLGATAKASTADRAAQAVAAVTGSGVLVNLGGDLSVAGPVPEGGWVVRIADRHDAPAADPGVTVAIGHGGLATSGTAARRWHRGGQLVHHLIDPATGSPATTWWRTVTVAADTCLAANTASTAAVVLAQRAPEWLAARGLSARLVTEQGVATAVGAWPGDALTPTRSETRLAS